MLLKACTLCPLLHMAAKQYRKDKKCRNECRLWHTLELPSGVHAARASHAATELPVPRPNSGPALDIRNPSCSRQECLRPVNLRRPVWTPRAPTCSAASSSSASTSPSRRSAAQATTRACARAATSAAGRGGRARPSRPGRCARPGFTCLSGSRRWRQTRGDMLAPTQLARHAILPHMLDKP